MEAFARQILQRAGHSWYRSAEDDPRARTSDHPHTQSGSWVLGRVGWFGPGRDGFIHLCAGAGTRHARSSAALWYRAYDRQPRILWQHFVLDLPGRLGLCLLVGTDCGSLWTGAGSYVGYPVLLGVYV